MKNLVYKMAMVLCTAAIITSCSLDEYNPTSVSGDETLATFDGWKGMQTYCYSSLRGELFTRIDYLSVAEYGTDIWITASNKTNTQALYYYEGLATNTNATNKLFKQAYSMINSCNAVIDRASSVDGDPQAIKVLTAEAHCLRALYYSILVTHYGAITLSLEESSTNMAVAPKRNSIEEIYAQIVSDLKIAANDLETTPYNNEYARCTKKTALGLLARVYAQGAGESLQESGVSYWQRARDVAADLINNAASYNAYLYDDVEDVWAQANNRSNREALFVASGSDAYATVSIDGYSNIFPSCYPKPNGLTGLYPTADNANWLYGRLNGNVMAPSKYLIDLFDAQYDKRWENSFTNAFGEFSASSGTYDSKRVEITSALCTTYGINTSFVGEYIYPYAHVQVTTAARGNQLTASVWPKGETSGDENKLTTVKNIYADPSYPLDEDENRFLFYLSKEPLTSAEKANRRYFCINIDDLFDEEGKYKAAAFDGTNSYQMFPGLSKFNWNYDGVFNSNLQQKFGDIFIMRMAETYLIAAEAEQKLGNAEKAADYLNVLRKRACRNASDYDAHMKLTSATEQDVLDEYARELCGEFNRWALLKRHRAFESQLQKGNPRAVLSFTSKHYLRPISFDFLNQISNKDEYGTNGY
ncbi:MAG: RagB/SusD family nutrient uptake outer membrane protein [Dysgonamonadaceae bacterium]|jgi:hypothetical protein|nr:RagB/SusD family nutrient uptake outer membrane protein [Dysgonamonadaceae bacterium]